MSDGHGQFIPIHFSAIDTSPRWCEFMASPEFATWAILCRYIWRADEGSGLGLHNLYRAGLLSCAVTIDKIVAHFADQRGRSTVIGDLKRLEERAVIERHQSTKPTIYILGRWEERRDYQRLGRIRVEYLYAEAYLADPRTTSDEAAPSPAGTLANGLGRS